MTTTFFFPSATVGSTDASTPPAVADEAGPFAASTATRSAPDDDSRGPDPVSESER
jgi:hypothetical protein